MCAGKLNVEVARVGEDHPSSMERELTTMAMTETVSLALTAETKPSEDAEMP